MPHHATPKRPIATISGGALCAVPLDVMEIMWRGQFCFRSLQHGQDRFSETAGMVFERDLLQIIPRQKAARASVLDRGHSRIIPTGMHEAQAVQMKKQGQCQEPFKHLVRVRMPNGEFIQKRLVLTPVLGRMHPHVAIICPIGVQTKVKSIIAPKASVAAMG